MLIGFLGGIIITIIILGFNTPLLPKLRIIYTLPGTHSEWITGIATFIGVMWAIWGKALYKLFNKPSVVILKSLENLQLYEGQNFQGHTRLLIANEGKGVARNIEIYVEKIYDSNNVERPSFLPVPLSWTHNGRSIRDLQKGQHAYLDLCRIDDPGKFQNPKLVLAAGSGVKNYEEVLPGETMIELLVYEKESRNKKYEIYLEYVRGDLEVKVTKIKRLLIG